MENFESVRLRIALVLKMHDVRKAAIFGSYARGDMTQKSDIDLVVEFDQGKSLLDLVSLKLDLEDALHKKVDVITYGSISPYTRNAVLKEQVPVL